MIDIIENIKPILYTRETKQVKNIEEFNIGSVLLLEAIDRMYKNKSKISRQEFDRIAHHIRRGLFYDSDKQVINMIDWLIKKYINAIKNLERKEYE